MTRFKELARIQSAVKHKNESELRWAEWYCGMRVQTAARKHHTQYWAEMQRKVANIIHELRPSSDGRTAPKGKWEHWRKFIAETPSIRKSRQVNKSGLCIGCGKNPCECRKQRKV